MISRVTSSVLVGHDRFLQEDASAAHRPGHARRDPLLVRLGRDAGQLVARPAGGGTREQRLQVTEVVVALSNVGGVARTPMMRDHPGASCKGHAGPMVGPTGSCGGLRAGAETQARRAPGGGMTPIRARLPWFGAQASWRSRRDRSHPRHRPSGEATPFPTAGTTRVPRISMARISFA